MQLGRNRGALNPLACKILVGMVAAGFLLIALFHQTWIPVEIRPAETGVLAAVPVAVRTSSPDLVPSRPQRNRGKRLAEPVTLAHSIEIEPPALTKTVIQTADISAAEPPQTPAPPVPTFAEEIFPLIRQHCASCHHPEADAGLVLTDPLAAISAADQIAQMTQSRQMPPWKPAGRSGHFQNDRRLSESEIALLQAWAKGGAPAGDLARIARDSHAFQAKTWLLGEPTVAYQLPEPFEVPASEERLKWNFVIPTGVQQELFLTGLELKPGDKHRVRSMILSYDPTGTARKKDQQTARPGFPAPSETNIPPSITLGEWAPGMSTLRWPKDSAYRIPPGADLLLTVKYASSPKATADPWSMGLHLSRSAPEQMLGQIEIATTESRPAPNVVYTLPTAVTLHSVRPLLKSNAAGLRLFAETPSGQTIPLIEIENWDDAWQERYRFREPITLEKSTRLVMQIESTDRGGRCLFEITTPEQNHLEPLLRHNEATFAQRPNE